MRRFKLQRFKTQFQSSKNFHPFRFSFWATEPIRKNENDGKFRKPYFRNQTWSWIFRITKRLHQVRNISRRISFLWDKLEFSLKIIVLAYVGRGIENFTIKHQVLKNLIVSDVSRCLFWAIEPIWKNGNEVKYKKLYFSGK